MTIRISCIHHYSKEAGTFRDRPVVKHLCRAPAVRLPMVTDPVTGDNMFKIDKDLMMLTDEPYPACRVINNGNCQHFEET